MGEIVLYQQIVPTADTLLYNIQDTNHSVIATNWFSKSFNLTIALDKDNTTASGNYIATT